jgi:L-asparaginase / beta-aspartyl-peptidase
MIRSDHRNSHFGILIHGGAKTKKIKRSSKRADEISKFLKSSVLDGFNLLKKGSNAVDAVEAAVVNMEDSGVFNAGAGAALTIDKQVEMDASIMDGKDISAGCVAMVQGIRNPIKLARQVIENTDHVMIVSEGALRFAKLLNIDVEKFYPSQKSLAKFNKRKKDMKNRSKNKKLLDMLLDHFGGTVGAVAIDRERNVASAVSTGGTWLKLPGRIGDSATIGGGFYADNSLGAACATGHGEYIMRLCLCKYACDQMQLNDGSLSSKKSIILLTKRFGKNTGGIITVDTQGRFGIAYNTQSMPVASIKSKDEKIRIVLGENQNSYFT